MDSDGSPVLLPAAINVHRQTIVLPSYMLACGNYTAIAKVSSLPGATASSLKPMLSTPCWSKSSAFVTLNLFYQQMGVVKSMGRILAEMFNSPQRKYVQMLK